MKKLWIGIVVAVLEVWQPLAVECWRVYPRMVQYAVDGDPGEPLFLTPLIEAGKTQEARQAASVSPLLPGVPSYSGYLTVNKQLGSNLFFWYFPAQKQSRLTSTLLWLQGGPGASSLFGLFEENGPFSVEKGHLRRREYSWSKNHNLIYIDNPVGTGYSFTKSDYGYPTNETAVGADLYSALSQFFTLFPDLQKTNFFVTGESYGGHYVPAITYTIHKKNPTAELKINLQGLLIGNGWFDPETQLGYGDYLYQHGLIDSKSNEAFQLLQEQAVQHIKAEKWLEASKDFDRIIGEPGGDNLFWKNTGLWEYYNYIDEHPPGNDSGSYQKFVQSSETRRAIHVGSQPYNDGSKSFEHLKEDVTKSVKGWVEELLEHYPILLFNGQLDIICAYPMMVNFMNTLKWSGAEVYKTAVRRKWYVDEELAGYSKTAGLITEVLVRNAGHMVPQDQPKWAVHLVNKFIETASHRQ